MNNSEFYDSFAADYNLMIPLEKQIESKVKFFKKIINGHTQTAADLGAGSGADSFALAKLGLKVTAFEPSTEMVKQAKANFANHKVEVETHNKKIHEIDKSFHNSFDLLVSLGNTFANINNEEIEQSVAKVSVLLKPGGKAVLQLLNYEKILSEKERIVNITESNEKQFIRFYDFCEDRVFFNILSINKSDFSNRQLITTEIFPYTKSFIEKELNKREYSKRDFYGDMNLGKFNERDSKNLLVVVEK